MNEYLGGAKEKAIKAAREAVVGQILEFLLASPGEQALRRILGIGSLSSLSGRARDFYENLDRSFLFGAHS